MFQSDLEDAFSVVAVIAGIEDSWDTYAIKVSTNWNKAVRSGESAIWDIEQVSNVKFHDRSREVPDEYIGNSLILGKTKSGSFIALDGSNRIARHLKDNTRSVKVFIVDISWLEDADDMDFDV